MARMFIFGLGYTASRVAEALRLRGWHIDATGSKGNLDFENDTAVRQALSSATHVLSSIPPDERYDWDPVLDRYEQYFRRQWRCYLSSTSVYGDTQGAWVDEWSPTGIGQRRLRYYSDKAWLADDGLVLRLPGIYGPGRSAIDRVRTGKAHRIDKPDQVFSRIHVDDIVSGIMAAIDVGEKAQCIPLNLADDLPCSHNTVIEEASRLVGLAPPPLQPLEEAGLSIMARSFYAENRRVANGNAKRLLGWRPTYPTYREGLRACLAARPGP